jgi:hypothetical protein
MKAEIYQSLYTINESLQLVAEHLGKLKDAEILSPEFAEIKRLSAEEMRAEINQSATLALHSREFADAAIFAQQRMKQEKQFEEEE